MRSSTLPGTPTQGLVLGSPLPSDAGEPAPAPQERLVNFELLRIFAMFIIVANHLGFKPGIDFPAIKGVDATGLLNIIATQSLCIGGKTGVFLFGMLSGYFLLYKAGSLSRVLRLWLLTLCCCLFFYTLSICLGHSTFNLPELIINLLPLTFYRYWFISAYVLLFLTAPLLNRALLALSRRQYLTLLIIFAMVWYLLPTLCSYGPIRQSAVFYENEFLTLCYAYACGAFVRRFHEHDSVQGHLLGGLVLLGICCEIAWLVACEFHALGRGRLYIFWVWITDYNSIFTLLLGISIFLVFKQFTPLCLEHPLIKKPVLAIAPCMFGVFLLHNPVYFKDWVWHTLIPVQEQLLRPGYLPWAAGMIFALFTACTALEYTRRLLCRPLNTLLAPLYLRLDLLWHSLFTLKGSPHVTA